MDDAAESARLLGMRLDTLPIEQRSPPPKRRSRRSSPAGRATSPKRTCRRASAALLLMALSNKFGELLVTTGNKSEMSVGYATLYGDMCGGYSVLKDIYKTEVYALARWRNAHVPDGGARPATDASFRESSITKAPTAELRPNQTDQDSLPPYDVLDAILNGLVEDEQSVDEIVARGFDREHRDTRAAPALLRGVQAPPGAARA